MKITINNKFILKILSKLFRLEPLSVVFKYEKTIYDSEVTNLGFLNQVKEEFSEQSEKFLQQLEEEIMDALVATDKDADVIDELSKRNEEE